ncbi:hypothetical protein N2152v2_001883 [Parachlorella kessleri]
MAAPDSLADFAKREWVNVLMGGRGYGFRYATTLSALHYIVCSLAMFVQNKRKQEGPLKERGKLPLRDLLLFTVVADASIICLNLSLLLNHVSTYQVRLLKEQIAKLLVIPYVCLVERFFLGSRVSREVLATILIVVLGVGIVTVEEVNFDASLLGLLIAAGSVVASGSQQILVRSMQQKNKISANDMLSCVAPTQAVTLLLLGPPVDKLVLGHSKTILVLVGGFVFMGETATPKKVLGMSLAVLGMILYGRASMGGGGSAPSKPAGPAVVPTPSKDSEAEQQPLLAGTKGDVEVAVLVETGEGAHRRASLK